MTKINNFKKTESDKKKEILFYKGQLRELIALLEEWAPKGADLPAIKKYRTMDLQGSTSSDDASELRIRNMRLEEEIRRLKASSGSGNGQIKESRVKQ